MSMLLTKRLARSLWRTKLRLSAVILMVAVGIFAGIAFGAYANAATELYEEIYDGEDGINLPDIWVKNSIETWNESTSNNLCQSISDEWPESEYSLNKCEGRLILNGLMYHTNTDGEEKLVPGVWHGIDEGDIDKVWMPTESEMSSGRLAETETEIVFDSHAALPMGIELGDSIVLGAGHGKKHYTVVGIGFHSQHLYFAQEGSLLPADAGTFATGYLTDTGLERLANLEVGSSNRLLIDIDGTPSYDLQSTDENEGVELSAIMEEIGAIVNSHSDAPSSTHDRSGVDSVEFLRVDAEGASKMFPYVTGMLAIVAGITIFLSLQRLIQSQAKEIAVLRTLGIPKKSIMPGYIVAPIFIGMIGALIGTLLGVYFGAPAMLGVYSDIIGLPITIGVGSDLIIQIVSIALIIVMLSGLRPAWQASQMQPLEVFRGHHEVKLSSRGLQQITAKLPATVGLSIRSSLRKPMRLAFTFFAVGLSMLIFGSMFFMMGTMEEVMMGGIKENQNWDVMTYVYPGGEDAVIEWAENNSVEHETMLTFPIALQDDTRELMGYGLEEMSTVDDDKAMMVIELKDGVLPQNGTVPLQILIDEGTSQFLEWNVGDEVIVMVGTTPVEVEITGVTKGEVSRTIYFHRSDLSDLIGIEATSVLLQFSDDDSIEGLAEVTVGLVVKKDMIQSFESLLDKQQSMYIAIEGLGIIIAVAVLFNTLLMNLSERDTELATLRVLGAPMNKLGTMMLWEHLAIGIVGGVLGALFAYFGTVAMISGMVTWAFHMTVEPQIMPILSLVGIVMAISIALTPVGMWRIKKMDLVEKVKDLSQ
ncbi:MAG TPA: FtsX-like permease family protein [Candidatus Thalassarchaeaceae archaeon]|nr:FtsX-like permease family protein [Candidatus Thalassarchaeaceae archaeon]